MISSQHLQFNPGQEVQHLPEMADKELVMVTNNVKQQSILAVPVAKEQSGKVFSRDVVAAKNNAEIVYSCIQMIRLCLHHHRRAPHNYALAEVPATASKGLVAVVNIAVVPVGALVVAAVSVAIFLGPLFTSLLLRIFLGFFWLAQKALSETC